MIFNKQSLDNIYPGLVRYTIENKNQTRISVYNFAAIWDEYSILKNNKRINIILSPNDFQTYINGSFNKIIGRVAGRIKNSEFELGGLEYKLTANSDNNLIHGGFDAMYKRIYNYEIFNNKLILKTKVSSKDDGFPGDVDVKVSYQLDDEDFVTIKIDIEQHEADGVFDPTSHTFFNLSNSNSVGLEKLFINGTRRLELNRDSTPTGKLIIDPYAKYGIIDINKIENNVFDDMFEISSHTKDMPIATLSDDQTKLSLDIFSSRNCLVVYNGANFSIKDKFNFGSGKTNLAIALEPQNLPDSLNNKNFGDITIKNGELKNFVIKYHLR